MRIISWNIKQGGRARANGIIEALVSNDPDVIVLGEYMPQASSAIIEELTRRGWIHRATPQPPDRIGGVAVLSRHEMKPRPLREELAAFDFRFQGASIPALGIELRAMYAPLHNDPYQEYWTAVIDELVRDSAAPVLVVGDLNTGCGLDSPASPIFCERYFRELGERGYGDLWRQMNGNAVEYTWHGRVNGYRLDHALGTSAIAQRVLGCSYDHSVREAKLSDHSMLVVDITGAD